MKKLLILSVVLLGISLGQVMAQTGTMDLKITLQGVQTISISSPSYTFSYATAADYLATKTTGVIADHITLSSTEKFTVYVEANGNFTNGTPSEDIPLDALSITPTLATSSTALTGEVVTPKLGTVTEAPQAFLKATNGTTSAKYGVTYSIAPGTNSANLINRPQGDYETTITYTITPD